jgi:hypothetical protein
VAIFFPDKSRFQDCLDQFFHKQRNAVSLGDDLLHHFGR